LLVLVVAVTLLVVASFAAVGPLLGGDGRTASASDAAAAAVVRIHVAQPGDTMWSIAQRYRGDVGQDRFVDALIDVNGGAAIQIGQAIRLP
jgi:LysM repeat protein